MWWIILGIIGYILLWGLTSSLLYKFFNSDSEESVILGSMFPFTLPVALVVAIFDVFNKLFSKLFK